MQPLSNLELHSEGVTYENMEHSKTSKESTTGQYQDLDQGTSENPGQYQELVQKPETLVKLVINKPEITYENTKMEDQNNSTPNQPEQSQYEELNTGHERNDEHAYSEVSLR